MKVIIIKTKSFKMDEILSLIFSVVSSVPAQAVQNNVQRRVAGFVIRSKKTFCRPPSEFSICMQMMKKGTYDLDVERNGDEYKYVLNDKQKQCGN